MSCYVLSAVYLDPFQSAGILRLLSKGSRLAIRVSLGYVLLEVKHQFYTNDSRQGMQLSGAKTK
jgi:hypothetical protein